MFYIVYYFNILDLLRSLQVDNLKTFTCIRNSFPESSGSDLSWVNGKTVLGTVGRMGDHTFPRDDPPAFNDRTPSRAGASARPVG